MLNSRPKQSLRMAALVVMFLALSFLSVPDQSNAADAYWVGGTGFWSEGTNWNPAGQPVSGDNVYLSSSDATDRSIYYDGNPGDRSVNLAYLRVDSTGTGTMTLSIPQGELVIYERGSPGLMEIGYNGTGIVNQTGGNVITSFFTVGVNPGGSGIYNLSSGHFQNLSSMGIGASSTFNHTGGSLHSFGFMGISGTYNISNNADSNPDAISIQSTGILNQSGGRISVTTGYAINRGRFNLSAGDFDAFSGFYNEGEGTVNFSGGSLTIGRFRNGGTFNYSGGQLSSNYQYDEAFTNNGTTNLSGTGTRTIDRNIVNNGTFKTTHTTAFFTGTFTNNGAYTSDPSTQYFNDLIVGQNGYMVGQRLDKFIISGDFINNSIMKYDWNTRGAYLDFVDGNDNIHDFYLAGADLGDSKSSFSNNFAWGTLGIQGEILRLFDGNSVIGAALYIQELLGATILNGIITNIFGSDGIVIYYDPKDKMNKYLAGLDYRLTGGGYLRAEGPKPVPEPAAIMLLGVGLIGLAAYGRKKLN